MNTDDEIDASLSAEEAKWAAEAKELRRRLKDAESKLDEQQKVIDQYRDQVASLITQRHDALLRLGSIQKLVDEQANDESLWFYASTQPEGHLQHALRKLHAVIETTVVEKPVSITLDAAPTPNEPVYGDPYTGDSKCDWSKPPKSSPE